MFDMHCHILYGVDDGPIDKNESLEMLKMEKEQGINTIVLTPHYRHDMFHYDLKTIDYNFDVLRLLSTDLGIKLLIGCEYHVNSHMIENFDNGRVHVMGKSNYILTEYKFESDYTYIRNNTIEAISCGYIPIIAHVERYNCLLKHTNYVAEIRNMGALIQVNADAVIGKNGLKAKHFTNKLIKMGLVDYIASDAHDTKKRACHMKEAYEYVERKHSLNVANKIFNDDKGLLS